MQRWGMPPPPTSPSLTEPAEMFGIVNRTTKWRCLGEFYNWWWRIERSQPCVRRFCGWTFRLINLKHRNVWVLADKLVVWWALIAAISGSIVGLGNRPQPWGNINQFVDWGISQKKKFKLRHWNQLGIFKSNKLNRLFEELKQKGASSSAATQKNNPNYTAAVHNSPKSTCLQHDFAIQITAGLLVLTNIWLCVSTNSIINFTRKIKQTNEFIKTCR